MDSTVCAAVEEICFHSQAGVSFAALCSKLEISPSVMSPLWRSLLAIPALQFNDRNGAVLDPNEVSLQQVENAEKLGVKIVADQRLRDNFIGLYESNVNISSQQRRTLERLAIARTNGVTQNQLAKEFGIEGRNFFYIMRNLECRGLIVRQPAVVRTREPCSEGEQKNSSVVSTNLVYLYRYAKHLDSQQRFEISKEEQNHERLGNSNACDIHEDDLPGEHIKEDVFVNDYLPPMKVVCNRLSEANGKVLVVSDIKRDLGYSGPAGHKAWRNIYHRLKDAGLVEDFEAVVNQKVEVCIRLIKNFPEKEFELKSLGCHNKADNQQKLKFGRKVHNTDQILELPIERQIYDMVDAEGSEGLHSMKVCERLGIDKKKSYSRWFNMLSRFGMHLQAESHGKITAYRVWTSRNLAHKSSKASSSTYTVENHDNDASKFLAGSSDSPGDSAQMFLEYDHLSTAGDLGIPEITQKGIHAVSSGTPSHSGKDDRHSIPPLEPAAPKLLLISESDACQKHSNQVQTADGARRERRILERLQDEEFILKPELHRWLMELEKDRGTKLDRKTVDRILQRLQRQGYCKCIHINVPVVTNCGRSRITQVVLHPSVQDLRSELLSRIHDRLRSFEMQIRGCGSSKLKNNESFPVLDGVQRTQNHEISDTKAARFEAMRTNGFVLAKMVRAKLLHGFLWDYVSKSQDWDATSLYGSEVDGPYVSGGKSVLFSLEETIRAIPFELFLQVVGSYHKFGDMTEKCKKGLCLSDLSKEEYKLLMDTHATGRLSLIIDILRRLKLIRLVIDEHSDNKVKVPHANLRHALELKPYVEEPVSIVARSNLFSFDLRPRLRHDFTLSNKEAVNEYWLTLEYCYAACDPRAAIYAFPGSAVGEVFLFRSWASVRVMTADQRADLLKRVMKENPNGKLSFKDCEKIAKELNIPFEQVLRVYRDKQQKRLSRFQSASDANVDSQAASIPSSTRKRKRSSTSIVCIVKSMRVNPGSARLDQQNLGREPHDVNMFEDKEDLCPDSSGEQDVDLEAYQGDDHVEPVDMQGPDADDIECHFRISPSSSIKLKPMRNKRFAWTETADRQLITQYARYRAALGAKFFRVDWSSLPELPAMPKACARRMAVLKRNKRLRRAIMKLCNILSERYQKQLQKSQDGSLDDYECRLLVRPSLKESLGDISFEKNECGEGAGCRIEKWDDFDDENVKKAIEDVLQIKQITKVDASEEVGSVPEKWSNVEVDSPSSDLQQLGILPAMNHGEKVDSAGSGQHKDRNRSSSQQHVQQKLVKLWSEGPGNGRHIKESVATSNAVELFKLIFLSPSSAMGSPNFLAETLRRYSECDLYAAFSYLRDRKIMIGGTGGQPFVLSQRFLHAISKSPFPRNAGKRAANFSAWLHDRRRDLTEGGVILTTDLQCGDIVCLFSLVSSGELSISPCLPDEGIGEAEDQRSWKRRAEDSELCYSDKAKKCKSISESELTSRREKGFPGVMVSVCRTEVPVFNALDLFKDEETANNEFVNDERVDRGLGFGSSNTDCFEATFEVGHVTPFAGEASWEVMAKYAEHFISENSGFLEGCQFDLEVFKTVSSNIKRAGDQGLSIEDISGLLNISGDSTSVIVDVLQAFGRAFRVGHELVNAYNAVRVVDVLYRPKYFLVSTATLNQESKVSSPYESQKRIKDVNLLSHKVNRSKLHPKGATDDPLSAANSLKGVSLDFSEAHRVTILNLPEEQCAPSENNTNTNVLENSVQGSPKLVEASNNGKACGSFYSETSMPIVPWISGDGTINRNVYNGLLRRILGIVMQNPGIIEDDIIGRMDVLNPQSCRQFVELMIRDRHLMVRKMVQAVDDGPSVLLMRSGASVKPKFVCREHFFANPASTYVL